MSLSNKRRAPSLEKPSRRVSWSVVVACLLGAPATLAQSTATLEAVRLHSDDAQAKAKAELEACKASSCPALPKLSLLCGVLALAQGESADALAQLSSVPAPAGLEPYHAFYSGEAAFFTRDYAAAARDFELALKAAPRSLTARATARAGEAWLAAGEPAKALPFLEKAADATSTPELLFQRAQARAATGHPDDARADWKEVALQFPAHAYAADAVAHLPKPRGAPQFTFNERLTRMRGFLDAGEPKAALAEADAIDSDKLARGGPALAREALLQGEALFALGQDDDAQAKLDIAAKGPRPVAAEAAILRARRVLRGADNQLAHDAMAEVDKKFPRDPPGEEGGYFSAWLDLQGARFADAVKAFTLFDKRHPTSRRRDEALWFKSLAQIRLEQYADARKTLESLSARFSRSSLVPQARYWEIRCDQLAGAPADKLSPRFTELIRQFPGSFYALLSAARLSELGIDPPSFFPEKPTQPKVDMPKSLELAEALSETGLFRDAGEEVVDRLAVVHTADDALRYGEALQTVGEFGSAYLVGVRLLWGQAYTQKKPEALGIFYPRAFRDAVESEAKAKDLDPFFVWAIMRRESAFRPEVVSVANARGLLQLIPKTISAIAKALKEPEPNPDALYSPQINIRYATWYLSALFKRFSHPILVAAAYNASPEAVAHWVATNGALPLDLFIEMIPFKETRGYVKQVVADYHVYGGLYGSVDKTPGFALTVPKPAEDGVRF